VTGVETVSAFDVLTQNLYVVAIIKLDNLYVTGAVVTHAVTSRL